MGLYSLILKMKEKMKKKQEIKMKKKFAFLTDILIEKDNDTNEKIKVLYEFVEKNRSEVIDKLVTFNELIQLLDNNVQKLQLEIDESKIIRETNVKEFKNYFMENNSKIKETSDSFIKKLNKINKDGLEREKHLENILFTKSEIIISEINDIKSLVKLLAVNELVDEIDILNKELNSKKRNT